MALPLIVPDWPVPARVHAACSTRAGGVSPPPYDSLNLGNHVGDTESNVAANRRRFIEALRAEPVFMNQVHGHDVAELTSPMQHGVQADGCYTSQPGLACTIMVADCLPVLLASQDGDVVGAAHAGWRGLAGGVIEATCARLPRGHTIAWLGPCIGPDAFEVGPEVRAAFEAADPQAAKFFRPHTPGKFLADLPGLASERLRAAGITSIHGNDGSREWCTVSNASRFFSHRRDRSSGRFAACVWLG